MEVIRVTYGDMIKYLNDMYKEEGLSQDFTRYIDRLLERGGDCYKILNALDYHIPVEELVKYPARLARRHASNLTYIDKERFIKLLMTAENSNTNTDGHTGEVD